MRIPAILLLYWSLQFCALAQGVLRFDGFLNGSNAFPPNNSTDIGQVRLYLSGNYLSGGIGVGRFSFAAVAAQLELSSGTVIFESTQFSRWIPDGEAGDWATKGATVDMVLTAEQREALLNGQIYARLTSVSYPNGELRGLVVMVPEPATMGLLGLGTLTLLWQFAFYKRRQVP